jgi:hypothetical protein
VDKRKLPKIFIYLSFFVSIFFVGVYFYIFEFDYIFEPAPVDIKLEKGNVVEFDFDVSLSCMYLIGIRFIDEQGGHENIKNVFGGWQSLKKLQARIDIQIQNSSNEQVFAKKGFGGNVSLVQYGPNPISFIAGNLYLIPGRYSVKIVVNEIGKEYAIFKSEFFVGLIPKTKCF